MTVWVRVPDGRGGRGDLRARYSTMAADLLALRDWLKQLGVTHVAMEATGVYWKAPYYVLEDDFELLLVNAAPHEERTCAREAQVPVAAVVDRFVRRPGESARTRLSKLSICSAGIRASARSRAAL